jgi:protein tyrosine/serine phosphatase
MIAIVRRVTLIAAFAALSCGAASAPTADGVPNFHQVNDWIYRGGQPTPQGFRSLAKLGVKTIIDLRSSSEQADTEKKQVDALGMFYVHVPLHGYLSPKPADLDRAFSVLDDRSQWPVFVHCREGKDRTGMIIACYRISHEGWTNQRAAEEAKSCADRDLHSAMDHYIMKYHPGPRGETER